MNLLMFNKICIRQESHIDCNSDHKDADRTTPSTHTDDGIHLYTVSLLFRPLLMIHMAKPIGTALVVMMIGNVFRCIWGNAD